MGSPITYEDQGDLGNSFGSHPKLGELLHPKSMCYTDSPIAPRLRKGNVLQLSMAYFNVVSCNQSTVFLFRSVEHMEQLSHQIPTDPMHLRLCNLLHQAAGFQPAMFQPKYIDANIISIFLNFVMHFLGQKNAPNCILNFILQGI